VIEIAGLFDRAPFESAPDDAMVAAVEAELGVRLPVAYVELARQHNGGDLKRWISPADGPTTWAVDHVGVTAIHASYTSARNPTTASPS
jgi:hypothetical protein